MKLLTALLFCLISGEAFGQAAVQQYGTIIPYDIPRWSKDHLIEDAGGITGKNGRGVNPFAILDQNKLGVCSYTDLTTKPYNVVCLGHDSNGNGVLSIDSEGGLASKDMFFIKDGVSYKFPFDSGGGGGGGGGGGSTGGFGYLSTVSCADTTDVTAALNSDMTTWATAGGGDYYLPQHNQCHIGASADLQIPRGVRVRCQMPAGGYVTNTNFLGAGCTLVLDPAHLIKAPNVAGSYSGIYGVRIVRKGYSAPDTMREAITEVNNFAGTAIVCPNSGTDFDVDHVAIIGFNWALVNSCERLRFTNSRFDTTNGFQNAQCFDTCIVSDVEAWPFGAGGPYTVTPQFQTTNISGVSNNGSGLIRVTLSSAPATPIITGDSIRVGAVGGVPANGRWLAAVINPTTIDLQGSSFSGAYTSGGKVTLTALHRSGIAFDLVGAGGGPMMTRITDFGHDVSMHFGGSSDTADCNQCWLDNLQAEVDGSNYDPVPVGLLLDGNSSHIRFRGGYINSPGNSIRMDSTGDIPLTMSDTHVVALGWRSGVYPIELTRGVFYATGNNFENTDVTKNLMHVASTFGLRVFTGNNIPGGNIVADGANGCSQGINNGSVGPCAFTIGVKGTTAVGTPTYQQQSALYSMTGGYVTVSFTLQTLTLGGATGNLQITGLPVTSTTNPDLGGCSFANYFGITLEALYTSLAGYIPPGSNVIQLLEQRFDGVGPKQTPVSVFAGNFAISGVCTYRA